jgi:holliday junction DNA helicase RuvA
VIGSLRGVVLDRDPSGEVLLEVGGVGYRVVVTPRTLSGLQPGEAGFLYTHHVQREDAQLLYGFASKEERWCFESLLGAHRVGPALALAILGSHGPASSAGSSGKPTWRRCASCQGWASRRPPGS